MMQVLQCARLTHRWRPPDGQPRPATYGPALRSGSHPVVSEEPVTARSRTGRRMVSVHRPLRAGCTRVCRASTGKPAVIRRVTAPPPGLAAHHRRTAVRDPRRQLVHGRGTSGWRVQPVYPRKRAFSQKTSGDSGAALRKPPSLISHRWSKPRPRHPLLQRPRPTSGSRRPPGAVRTSTTQRTSAPRKRAVIRSRVAPPCPNVTNSPPHHAYDAPPCGQSTPFAGQRVCQRLAAAVS